MKSLSTLVLLLLASIAQATSYYFSSSGDDSYSSQQAQNPASPWKTLNKLNSLFGELKPGDAVYFKRGDVFTGTITVSASGTAANPIVIASYGNGANPVITGFSRLGQWSTAGSGIWVSEVGLDDNESINTVLLNSIMQPLGRFPNRNAVNGGYLIYETYSGSSSITDQQLSSSPQWNNAEVIIRKNRWVLDRNKVEAHSGSTVTYKSETGYYGTNNYGYFFQNHPATLDQPGEWYYDQDKKKLGIYLGSQNPSAFAIDAALSRTLVTISRHHHLIFKNLDLSGSNISTFRLSEAQGITIENCNLLQAGTDAVTANNTTGLVIRNTLFEGTNNIAFNGDNCSNTTLSNNRFINTGIHPGMGKGNSGSYEAILLSGNNNLVEYNTISNTGYIPITFSGNAVTVKNNVISNFALVKDDGGGIYTWNNSTNPPVNADRKIIGNIISKGRGAGEGTDHPNQAQVHGIYIDDNADHVVIQGNTVSECAATGIFLHNAHDISLIGNTLYNNS
ncbi:MAG: right-handed parallel beta-helix repeat-containing protein, partial [Chitinophagaceae bacterium]